MYIYRLRSLWNQLWRMHLEIRNALMFDSIKSETKTPSFGRVPTTSSGAQKKDKPPYGTRQRVGLLLGPTIFTLVYFCLSPAGMPAQAQAVLACTLWIAVWWMTEAAPIPATSLLPVVIFPLTGALELDITTRSYGDEKIFLFMGGFMIALTMERWNLHKRMALNIISVIGTNTDRIILGAMIACGFLSMWISNTATSMMMIPIGMAIIYQVSDSLKKDKTIDTSPGRFPFGTALMLGIAYSASIGGMATLIGTPPNAVFAATVEKYYGVEISFASWMVFGLPVSTLLLVGAWFYLVKIAYPLKSKNIPGGKQMIENEKRALGPITVEERSVLIVFCLTALAWISRDFLLKPLIPEINDTMIAIIAAVTFFIFPAPNYPGTFLLNWETAKKLPWGILILFGGGLAIASGFKESGLAQWMGEQLTLLHGVNFIFILAFITIMVTFLTEITSNTATSTMMYSIMASLAAAIHVHPYGLMVASGLAASCAFMLPVSTPPNAVVFGSGSVQIGDMAKSGIWMNLISILVILVSVYILLPAVWGIDLQTPMK
ncbi:SLC13 family permease [Melghirimyces algeriensis]|uniref:Sodium-dependent dicarboxylate transporter SdcS n=1 Tax=Melghirimyces algeriensis TaxID=910412 RepID=A0A521DZQ3_9BACL|nr:DASS family sodium-coupled anion symporter [Melghirimyces algeriensis]SMO77197.1 solute carrier family 13 (sodium-dependent dicarboxylate transporter), member 2/3/5 [Melghirimyces algeriensis]